MMKRQAPRTPEALTSPGVNQGTAFTIEDENLVEAIADTMWKPVYGQGPDDGDR